jgi:hypothetical protein
VPKPDIVGGTGLDDNAAVAGTLTWAEGSFTAETGGTNESDNGNANVTGPNSFTVQLNSNFFGTNACNSSTDPLCQGWQQFIYEPPLQQAYIEYWVIPYPGNCPQPFTIPFVVPNSNPPIQGCAFNSPAISVPALAASNLANVAIVASTDGVTDTLTVFVNGTSYPLSQPNVLGLASGWQEADFNVYGDAGGSQASFNSPTSLEVQVVTESKPPTRAAPSCDVNVAPAESNSLNLTGGCCPFGGDLPGIQFLESNISNAPVPPCPALTATPSPVPVPAGGQGFTTLSVVGNLVGQSDNTQLQPTSCSVSGQAQATQDTAAPGEEFDFVVPASSAPGSVLTDTANCDTGQQVTIPIAVQTPIFSALPNPLSVQQGGPCANFTASLSPSTNAPGLAIAVTQNNLPAGVTLSQLGTTVNNSATFAVCASLSAPVGSYGLVLTSSGNTTFETNTAGETVDITACQPIPEGKVCTSTPFAACGTFGDGCGGTYNCPACTGGTSCSNNVCCPSGMVGSDGNCCPNGEVYYGGIGCRLPCAAGTIPCPIAGGCTTPAICDKINTGPQPPNCARHHTCM